MRMDPRAIRAGARGIDDVGLCVPQALADAPDDGRRGAAGVHPVQPVRRRPGVRAGRQDLQSRADRQHPAPAGRRPAVLRPARDLLQADPDRRLRRVVEHERAGVAHPRDAARALDDGARAAARARDDRRDRAGARRRLRARLADRPHGDDRLHGRPVDLDPRLHHRVPVRVRVQAGLVPGAGLGQRLLGEPRQVRVAADPDRPHRQHRAEPAAVPDVRAGRDQPGLRAHGAREGPGREPHHVGARAAQRVHPHHHARDGGAARPADRRVPARAVLLDPRHRPRGDPRRRALGLPGDQGADRLRRDRHDDRQPRWPT